MNRKKLKYFGLIIMLLALFAIIPPAYADPNTDSGGGTGGGTGDTNVQHSGGIYYPTVQGVMFSVVDASGNRLPGTTSLIIGNQDMGYLRPYTIMPSNGMYFNKKEVLNNYQYATNFNNWSRTRGLKIYSYAQLGLKRIENYITVDEYNQKASEGGYVLDYVIKHKKDGKVYWEWIANKCNYSYENYKYDEIENHYLIFEPMIMFKFNEKNYFMTYQQAASYIYKNRKKSHVSNLLRIPVRSRMGKSIYMRKGTAGFNAGANRQVAMEELIDPYLGFGIGSINIAKECEDTGLDCGRPECKIQFNSHFPIDPATGKVLPVIITDNKTDNAQAVAEGTEGSINCCNYLLVEEFGNDKEALCTERPECCYDCNIHTTDESNATSCLSSTLSTYSSPATDDINTWYCMKAFDQYSPYAKLTVNQYSRIVCREDLTANFPNRLETQQSVGSYMIWPTPSSSSNDNYSLEFKGTLTCKLSIDKAEIEATGNANAIYDDIYNKILSYTNNGNCDDNMNCTAKEWYKLNNNINLTISYNDDEYGGTKISLVTDVDTKTVDLINNSSSSSNKYKKLNDITIKINNTKTYKLSDDTYKKITTSGIGSNNLNNMFDEINKNQFVIPKFNYGILPISYTAKVSRNISTGASDYYKLTLTYRNVGDNGKFVTSDKDYTCPYEVTFAPPTNTNDNNDGEDTHDDNNDAYENYSNGTCVCPKGTTHCSMDLRGYLIKNSKMTCAQAQAIYCNSDRGNMNVEYRVISLTEPFPGSGENAKTMAQGGRDIGYNWRDSVDQTTSGGVVSTFILNNRRVKGYEVYNLEPLYVIELDSAKIKTIRDYNKTTTYADFNLTCVNDKDGTICTSPFLDQYVSSGTCHTAHTKDKFYKCADKDVPASEK